MKLVDKYHCAIPDVLVPSIDHVVTHVGVHPISVYRGPEAAPIINKYGSHTQEQLWDASPAQRAQWGVLGTPDRPGRSTHECRSDGVAFSGPVGRRIEDGQCGMDWPNSAISAVMADFRSQGLRPFHPYNAGVEYHHVDLLKSPKIVNPFLPLHPGQVHKARPSTGLFVYILASRLQNCGYLKKRTSRFDSHVEMAVRNFQHQHHMKIDGIVGDHTWTSLKAAERWCKKHHKREWTKPV